MLDPITVFYVSLATIVLAIATMIVRAVRLTNASIKSASAHVDLTNPEVARAFAEELRARDVPCPSCGGETSTVLGTGNRYRCDRCRLEFEGPIHMPAGGLPEG